ncbi:VWA domain-containing protein, partial [bacterium]|nr:VWA domain-containing protein [bacterium]
MNRFKNVVLLFSFLAILIMASSTQLYANNMYLPFATSIDTSYNPGNFEDFEPELEGDWQEFYNLLSPEKLDLNYDQLYAGGEIKILDGYKVKKVAIEACKFKKITLNHEQLSADWLFDKLIKAGAVKYKACDDDALFYMKKGAQNQCWIEIHKGSDSFDLNLYFNNLFGIGDEFEVKRQDVSEKENLFYFVTNSIPSKSLSFKVNLAGEKDSTVKITCSSRVENGKLVMALDRQISAEGMPISVLKTNQYVFDNIPVVEGQLFWTIDFKEDKPVESVKIRIDTNGEIPSVNYGEKPGILKLIGAPSDIGAIMVSSSGQTFSHPDIDSSRLKSPVLDENGNYVFTAPADLYRVSFGESEYLYDVDCKYFMNLIPVNSGEVTTITLSDEVKNAIRELRNEFVNTEEKTPGSITINDVNAKNDNAEVAIVINDPLDRDVFPEIQDITIAENGFKGKVKDVKREMALSSIVLLLDSSGSMGENMKPAVEAAKSFVNSLNENSDISLIQFAQEITVHKGNTKKDVLKSLDTIKSIGATAMYDATAQALKLLEKKDKPFIVLFSDGADSREPGIDGKGSDLTQEQIIKQISQSNATVLTIGFGKGHDPKVLQAMSNASKNGAYVAARDKAALPAAFAKVASKFGNQFNISYERPYASVDVKSDVPVISIMMDLSGSMDSPPEEDPEDDLDYRIDKIKYVFHDFIRALPEKILMVFQSFTNTPKSSEILCRQALTSDKPAILQAIADCTARGGTPINQALKVALTNLQTVNSSKRVLVFFTDAALDSEWKNDESGATKLEYERLLETVKNEGIRILFAGLGGKAYISKYEGAFKNAAELSGGDYVISANPDDIQAKLNELLKKVEEPAKKSNMLRFNIALNCKAEDGSRMDYAAGKSLELAPLEKTGITLKPA